MFGRPIHPTTNRIPTNVKKCRKLVKYPTADKFYGTARKHRTMHQTAETVLEEKKRIAAVNKKVDLALRRLNLRRKNKQL